MLEDKLTISYETENIAYFILFNISVCKWVQSIQQNFFEFITELFFEWACE